MKCFPVLACCFLVMYGCRSSNKPPLTAATVADTAKFYPLENFFRSQVEYVDLRDFPIYRISSIDGKKDSTQISKEAFREWASAFRRYAFNEKNQKSLFRETVFEDMSTNSYTINYMPYDASKTPVKNIDILLSQETNMVKRIFIKAVYERGDTTIEEQGNWKADKSFQVNRTKIIHGKTVTELHTVNWNDSP